MSYSLYDTIFLNTGNLITSTFRDDIVVLENTKETGTTDKDCRLVIRSNEDGESDIHLENLNGSTRNGWRIMNYTQGEYFSIGYRVGYTTSVSDYNFGWNEYLTVKNNGNVGIRTTNPISTLQVGHTGTTTDTSLHVLAGDSNTATIAAYGSSQGTGKLYVGQSSLYGGGIVYNGDDDPDIFSTEDAVSFYRRNNGTDYEVFYYKYNESTVNFNGSGEVLRLYENNYPTSKRTFIGFYPEDSTRKGYLGFGDTATNDFTILNQYSDGDIRIGAGNGIKMQINSDGNVGIGTTNPTSTLQVGYPTSTTDTSLRVLAGDSKTATIEAYGSTQGTAQLYLGESSTNGGGIIYNGDDNPNIFSTTNAVSFYRRYNGTDYTVFLYSYSSSIVSFTDRIRVGTGSTGLPPYSFINDHTTGMYNPSTNELSFSTSGTERVRIDSSGYVGIGTTNPTSTLQLGHTGTTTDTSLHVLAGDSKTATIEAYGSTVGTARLYLGKSSTYGGGIIFNGDDNPNISSGTNTVSFYRRLNGTDTEVFYYYYSSSTVFFTGNITCTSLTQTSDDRLKINEEYITSATETLLKLRPQVYDKLTSVGGDVSDSRKEAGLIAQEVYVHAPELRYILDVPEEFKEDLDNYTNLYNEDPTIDPDYSGWSTSNVMGVDYQNLTPYLIKAVQEKHDELQETKIELNLIKEFLKQKYPGEL